jgi:aspartate aminotransferase
MAMRFSQFARGLSTETAFTVLALAKELRARGKDVVELEIGDSPFASSPSAVRAGIAAIEFGMTHYCPSMGLPELREAAAECVHREFGLPVTAANVVIGSGAKIFETYFCEAVLDAEDEVLVFAPYFPTYPPNIARRGARIWLSRLGQEHAFRPNLSDIERFLREAQRPRAIFLNSPHNPTGGVTTRDDLAGMARLAADRDVWIFSDEPYCHMVWSGEHRSLLAEPGMLDRCVGAYTFSKSYSMSGWRLGFAVASRAMADLFGKLINTSLSCVPPMVQAAGAAALKNDSAERDSVMRRFQRKVELFAAGLARLDGVRVSPPVATFYVFPNVAAICNRHGITSHGLALYLLQAADDQFGVACLGGECFGEAGHGFLRFSCAEPDERIARAVEFLPDAWSRADRIRLFLSSHPEYHLASPYPITTTL